MRPPARTPPTIPTVTAPPTDDHQLLQPLRQRLPFGAILLAWTVWGLAMGYQTQLTALAHGGAATPVLASIRISLGDAWSWALVTPFVMEAARRLRQRRLGLATEAFAHLMVFLAVHCVVLALYRLTHVVQGLPPLPLTLVFVSALTIHALFYIAIVFLVTGMDSHERLRAHETRQHQLQKALALAQLHALRSQLQPHFLFNALNAIAALIHSDPGRADKMLGKISELLRIVVDTAPTPEIRLRDELRFALGYLDIEQMRYGDRLAVCIDVPEDALEAMVPSMLIQPLVENAVRHGVAPHARPGQVRIRAARDGDALQLAVSDTGNGFLAATDHEPEEHGVGLSATRARLEKLYGSAHTFGFHTLADGFEVRVSLPFRTASVSA